MVVTGTTSALAVRLPRPMLEELPSALVEQEQQYLALPPARTTSRQLLIPPKQKNLKRGRRVQRKDQMFLFLIKYD